MRARRTFGMAHGWPPGVSSRAAPNGALPSRPDITLFGWVRPVRWRVASSRSRITICVPCRTALKRARQVREADIGHDLCAWSSRWRGRLVPDDAPVTSTNQIGAHLSARQYVHGFPVVGCARDSIRGCGGCFNEQLQPDVDRNQFSLVAPRHKRCHSPPMQGSTCWRSPVSRARWPRNTFAGRKRDGRRDHLRRTNRLDEPRSTESFVETNPRASAVTDKAVDIVSNLVAVWGRTACRCTSA